MILYKNQIWFLFTATNSDNEICKDYVIANYRECTQGVL